jgi:hypothetical protein
MPSKALICIPLILAGCTPHNGDDPPKKPVDEYAHDARDVIPNDVPLPDPRSGQRPVVGVKKMLVSVIHWQDGDILNDSLIETDTVSNNPNSLRSFLLAASNGKLTLDGKIISHTSGPRPDLCKSGSPYPISLATDEGAKAARAKGLDPDSFDYLINVIDCGGYASAFMPGRIMGVYGQSGGPNVYWHEFGHNLGYDHGFTYTTCRSVGETVHAPGVPCTTVPYGDSGDTVSGPGTLYPANNRWYSGWLDNSEATVIDRTGNYHLNVLGKGAPQLYLINRAGLQPPQLALEYRKPNPLENFPPDDNRVNGVWVRYTTMEGSLLITQLDGTPETASTMDPTLVPGKILKDEIAGITIKVCDTSDIGAYIAVSVNNEAIPSCAPPPPDVSGPDNPYNPITYYGKAMSEAEIYSSCIPQLALDTTADLKGDWDITTPYLSSGKYTCEVRQRVRGLTSDPRHFTFTVRK